MLGNLNIKTTLLNSFSTQTQQKQSVLFCPQITQLCHCHSEGVVGEPEIAFQRKCIECRAWFIYLIMYMLFFHAEKNCIIEVCLVGFYDAFAFMLGSSPRSWTSTPEGQGIFRLEGIQREWGNDWNWQPLAQWKYYEIQTIKINKTWSPGIKRGVCNTNIPKENCIQDSQNSVHFPPNIFLYGLLHESYQSIWLT